VLAVLGVILIGSSILLTVFRRPRRRRRWG
jgi:hypothetical protein